MSTPLKLPVLMLLVVLTLSACPGNNRRAAPISFKSSLGARFDYSPKLSIEYNPHGGADRVMFQYEGIPIGAMFVTSSPPEGMSVDMMIDIISKSTKKQYGATSVEYSKLTNKSGQNFHHFSSDAHKDGKAYRYELFLHIDKRNLPSLSQSMIVERFGMHKFEFVIPDNKFTATMPLLDSVIDSFTPMRQQDEGSPTPANISVPKAERSRATR